MKKVFLIVGALMAVLFFSCSNISPKNIIKGLTKVVLKTPTSQEGVKILFLHHSTGRNIWNGGVEQWFKQHNESSSQKYHITEQVFPASTPYGWKNYPFDYWNIWVNHQGKKSYKKEPTLELITEKYDVVIFKHCFPVSNIKTGNGEGDVSSDEKTLENYKLQYNAIREKLHSYPKTKFILWTGAALVKEATTEEKAKRAQAFFNWVRNEWNRPDDNIYLWDFYELETEGSLYLLNSYAAGDKNSHPNKSFSRKVAPLFCQRIVDVIENKGTTTDLTGQSKM